jgi:hypothetical protein
MPAVQQEQGKQTHDLKTHQRPFISMAAHQPFPNSRFSLSVPDSKIRIFDLGRKAHLAVDLLKQSALRAL